MVSCIPIGGNKQKESITTVGVNDGRATVSVRMYPPSGEGIMNGFGSRMGELELCPTSFRAIHSVLTKAYIVLGLKFLVSVLRITYVGELFHESSLR